MRAIFCCLDRKVCLKALKYLESREIDILCCLVNGLKEKESFLREYCRGKKIRIYQPEERSKIVEEYEQNSVDLLITFTYSLKLDIDIINRAKLAINFHPAPLPDYRGCGTTSHGILNRENKWEVTCHHLDKELDTGKIIAVRKFRIDEDTFYTGMKLSEYAWEVCYDLLQEVVDKYVAGERLESIPQSGGHYYSKKYLEELKEIKPDDGAEVIERKIRAFWYPPFEGAYVMIGGKKFYLIDEKILDECGSLYQKISQKAD